MVINYIKYSILSDKFNYFQYQSRLQNNNEIVHFVSEENEIIKFTGYEQATNSIKLHTNSKNVIIAPCIQTSFYDGSKHITEYKMVYEETLPRQSV